MSHSAAAVSVPLTAAGPDLAAAWLGYATLDAQAPCLPAPEVRLVLERAHPPPAYLRNSVLRI